MSTESPRGPRRRGGRGRGPDRKRFVIGREPTGITDGTLWFLEFVKESQRATVPNEQYTTVVWNTHLDSVVNLLTRQGFDTTYWVISDERDGHSDPSANATH